MLSLSSPGWLFGLLLLPLLALFHWQAVEREKADADTYAEEAVMGKMRVQLAADKRFWRGVITLAAVALVLVALAQPRWGVSSREAAAARAGGVVFVLDVSTSMLVRDVSDDSRLKMANDLIAELLSRMAGWRVGLVAFSGEAEVLCPLTTDHNALKTLLARARPGVIASKGSNIEAGLRAAIPLFRHPGKRSVVLISDGEALNGDADLAIEAVKEAKIAVWAVGAGTLQGGPVPGEPDVWGKVKVRTFKGEPVISKLDMSEMGRIAAGTDGATFDLADPRLVQQILPRLGVNRAATPPVVPTKQTASEPLALFQLTLALALVLAIAEALMTLFTSFRRERRFAEVLQQAASKVSPLPAKAAAAALLLLISQTQSAWTLYPTWLPNREAESAMKAGDLPRAEALLRGALAHDPGNFRLRYNLGNVLYEKGNFEMAAKVYEEALAGADAASKPMVQYNIGNAHFRSAEKKNDMKGYEQALSDYEAVLVERPEDTDAKHNWAVAKARLERSKKNNGQSNKAQNQQGQRGNNQQNAGVRPIAVQTTYKPPPLSELPTQHEVDKTLKALEADERKRQAEQAENPRSGGTDSLDDAKRLIEQALGSMDMQKDW